MSGGREQPAVVVIPGAAPAYACHRSGRAAARLRIHSTFAHFTLDELEAGFRRLEQAIAADPGATAPADDATLLTPDRRQ